MLSRKLLLIAILALFTSYSYAADAVTATEYIKTKKVNNHLIKKGKKCIECHATKSPGMVEDWKNSRHAHSGVSCIDCHEVKKDSKLAAQNCPGVKGTKTFVTALVTPKRCATCHPKNHEEFTKSGHFRARKQYINKKGLNTLINVHEGQNHPKYGKSSNITGCAQCHGSIMKLDKNRQPLPESWPNAGIGTIWPDGSVGNCTVCHTRHKFDIAEARKPEACASCHLGPDHPDIEIFNNSKHGQIYRAEGHKWKFDDPTGAWQPGSYRGPTCATCHMSGTGKTIPTHNVSKRLKWNLWAKLSKVRNSPDPMSPLTGDGIKGRKEMRQVCNTCHSTKHSANFFTQADGAINLYNEAYFKPAEKMRKELAAKNLLHKNPWKDDFLKKYYFLWHHEGRRARQGAAMAGPDYAHWHGFFELQIDLYELQEIYKKRMKTGKITH